MTKFNPEQKEGHKALENLLKLTKEERQEIKVKSKVIESLEEIGVFD
jgi:hypothetical protein